MLQRSAIGRRSYQSHNIFSVLLDKSNVQSAICPTYINCAISHSLHCSLLSFYITLLIYSAYYLPSFWVGRLFLLASWVESTESSQALNHMILSYLTAKLGMIYI